MSGPRIAFLGAGDIARYHATAAVEAGFRLAGVAASPGSTSVAGFAEQYGFSEIHRNPSDLFGSSDWDALLVCSSHESLLGYTTALVGQSRPALVEKPVALHSEDLLPFVGQKSPHIAVAYNRRQYATAAAAKDFFSAAETCVVTVEIPESVDFDISDTDLRFRGVFANSVHMLDLVRFLVGSIIFSDSDFPGVARNRSGTVACGHTNRGDLVIIKSAWNSPANFSITLESGKQRFLLSPIERGQLFQGLTVAEPTEATPVRVYSPQLVEEYSLDLTYRQFKPGFVEQMLDFRALVENGSFSPRLANLEDSYHALAMAELLVGAPWQE